MNKRGFTIAEVPTLALTLGLIAIVLAVMAAVLVSFQGSQENTDSGRTTTTQVDYNDTFTTNATLEGYNTTAVNFATGTHKEFVSGSCTAVSIFNHTGTTVNVTKNFTISGCKATWNGAEGNNGTIMTANYTFSSYEYGAAYNATQEGVEGLNSFSEWQGTFVVVLAAAIIIGIIGAYLFFKPRE